MFQHALLVLVFGALVPSRGVAAPPTNYLTYDPGYPKSTVVGKILASGDYRLDPGWVMQTVTILYASPVRGTGGNGVCGFQSGAWSGHIAGLPSGKKYNVRVVMVARNPNSGELQTLLTPMVEVTVK